MINKDSKIEKEERIQRRNERINRKVESAKQPDTRVVSAKSEDVNIILNMLAQTDTAMIRMRKYIGGRVEPEVALKYITDFEKIILQLQEFTANICKVVDMTYNQSRTVAAIEKKYTKNNDETSSAD